MFLFYQTCQTDSSDLLDEELDNFMNANQIALFNVVGWELIV